MERKCLADERQNFCLIHYGRNPGYGLGFLAWVAMLSLGALHSAFSVIPALSFLESFLATLMAFAIIVFAISMATKNVKPPTRRHGGR